MAGSCLSGDLILGLGLALSCAFAILSWVRADIPKHLINSCAVTLSSCTPYNRVVQTN